MTIHPTRVVGQARVVQGVYAGARESDTRVPAWRLSPAQPSDGRVPQPHGGRTARENVTDLVDAGSWVEYGRFATAAQRAGRDPEDLVATTPADGLVAAMATVDGHPTAVLAYDYTVLAGTQSAVGHLEQDRLFELIDRMRLPVVCSWGAGSRGRWSRCTRSCSG